MSEKFLVDGFKWIKNAFQFNENFTKNYNEDSCTGYFFETDEEMHNLNNYLLFFPEKMTTEKFEKVIANLYNKNQYVMHKKVSNKH